MANDDGIFLRNTWYVAAWNHELIDGKKVARTILERPIVLYRGASGQVVALDDRCCHRAAPLSMGRVEGDDIRCMYHGMKFAADGKCIQIPGQDVIPAKLGVRSYPVVERYNLIFIWTGDPEKADPKLILDYPPLEDPRWRGLPGYMHYKANWLLIVDNLSDFAHLAFVHTNTLGGSEEYAYKTKPVAIEKLDDGFRVERWHMGAEPPPYHKKVIPNKTDKIDRRNIGRMIVPGIFTLDTTFAPAGQGVEKGVQVPGTRSYRNAQFMTPETRSTTHFFWNYLHDFDIDNPNIALSLRHSLEEGFNEDKDIIEAQQRVFDADPDYQLLAIGADAPLTYFRWLFARKMEAEKGTARAA
ncbi:aromatic ring-hydroxylating dioxygenase subunit alpha [Bradyrhizobium tropiciagri]|uniref:aromatic ring-hydroxylating dioxygenase subunit alpha n=1 Tax=Bradyrhizobium tropiciagri TaxID=312253 RepID=UPI001BA7769A|nr:aromatic ring-hydroxylating dioxygenase subunit alpha [Bradyrhizobium tropiciagri]MBR0870006.1 aromatic ring-hydroxylating dioxygenase subunit alpha [Bradyrhizobium tropiciagri]